MTAPAASTTRLRHVPALDGLRGIAVIGVLFFHAGHLRGGFLGVDLFFVLSGFLITSLLLLERDGRGAIALGAFWARRARRLLPAMFAVVVAALLLAPVVLRDDELGRFRGTALASLGYVANWWAIARDGDYFALFDSPAPLDHFWSLAIEEQFYVVWPFLVAVALAVGARSRFSDRSVLRVAIGVGIVASWAAMITLADSLDTTRAYYGTDTRAGALLVGALAATYTTGRTRRDGPLERWTAHAAIPAVVALAGAWAVTTGSDVALYRWGFPAHALLVTVVVVAITGPAAGPVGAALAIRPLRAVGLVSYGLYLWHWPIYVWLEETRTGLDGWTLTAVRLAVSGIVAVASYHLIEQPVRTGRWPRTNGVPIAVVTAAACVLIALVVTPTSETSGEFALDIDGGGAAFESDDVPVAGTSVLLVGDSGADALGDALVAVGAANDVTVAAEGVVGCGLVQIGDGVAAPDGSFYADPPDCDRWPDRWTGLLAQHRPDVSILVLSWGGVGDRDLGDGILRGPCDDDFDAMYAEQVRLAIATLRSDGGRVLLATTAPNGVDRSADDRTACLDDIYRDVAYQAGADIVDVAEFTCPDGVCDPADTSRPDGVHYAGDGAVAVAGELFAGVVDQIRRSNSPRVVFVGDSQALVMVESAPSAKASGLDIGSMAELGCGLSPDDVVLGGSVVDKSNCAAVLAALPDDVAAVTPDLIVVQVGVWEAVDAVVDGERLEFGTRAWEDHNRSVVGAGLDSLAPIAPVAVLTTPCFRAGRGLDALGTTDVDERVRAVNDILTSEATDRGFPVVDFGGHLCPSGDGDIETLGVPSRPDGVHLDEAGVSQAWSWLLPRLVDLVG